MTRQKEFDCVAMKWQVQEKIRERYAGVPEKEAHRLQREAALADPYGQEEIEKPWRASGTLSQ